MAPILKPMSASDKQQKLRDRERAWLTLRREVLKRDHHKCRAKSLGGCFGSLDVHHIRPKSVAGHTVDSSGLIAVCRLHHQMLQTYRLRIEGTDANQTVQFVEVQG